jgi:uncharacterized protein YbjQ (UPF0145 family)
VEWRIDTIVTTTPTIEGRAIGEYLGVVAGEAILGAHIGREIKASLTDIFGGRSAEYEEEVRKARACAGGNVNRSPTPGGHRRCRRGHRL